MLDERGDESTSLTFGELDRRSRGVASFLESRSAPNDRILLGYTEPLEFMVALIGCAYAGRIGVPIAMPASGKHDKGRWTRIAAIADDCTPSLALSSEKLVENVWPHAAGSNFRTPLVASDSLASAAHDVHESRSDELFYLQYTSGSTGNPRGVRIAHRNLAANLRELRDTMRFDTSRPFVSWVPHFHDFGLVTMLLFPLAFNQTSYVMTPTAFLKRPARWLEAISRFGAASTAAPPFALDVCVRRITPDARETIDLRSLTTLIVGAEPIHESSLRRFTDAFSPCGFARSAWAPAYGLAEVTVFATTFRADEGYRLIEFPDGTRSVSCGRSPAGLTLRIVDQAARTPVADGTIGEIVLNGPSVSDGYWSAPIERVTIHDTDGSAAPYLATGDLGAIVGGELAVVGRIKDVVIINGANFHAEDIEETVLAATHAFAPAGCAVFGRSGEGGERLIVALEISRSVPVRPVELLEQLRVIVDERHGAMVHDLIIARPGNLPRTSSGKIRRSACREAYACGKLGLSA